MLNIEWEGKGKPLYLFYYYNTLPVIAQVSLFTYTGKSASLEDEQDEGLQIWRNVNG